MQQANASLGAPQAYANAATTPEQTHASNLAQGCEALAGEMLSLESRVAAMLTRLAGPIPTAGGAEGSKDPNAPSGLMGTIEKRLTAVAHSIRRTHDLMQRLERIV